MIARRPLRALIALLVSFAWLATPSGAAVKRHEATGHLTFDSPQSDPMALSPDGTLLLVASTTSGLVDVIDTGTNTVVAKVEVGMEPVGVAFKPDGSEAWVTNHVSDSVSVIDTASASASYLEVVETIQSLNGGVTEFDEPVGVVFASNAKAYVSLSSINQIAIIDANTYSVTGTLDVTAQDPRAMRVANGRLYVASFESFNQSQLSICGNLNGTNQIGDPCSMGLLELVIFAQNPNLPNSIKNIVINPDLPDRDLFVYNTNNDNLIKTVSGIGTLLYGLAVDANDVVYVTQTDARNAVNGDHDDVLDSLDNEMFDNLVSVLDCGVGGGSCSTVNTVDLDPVGGSHAQALATPYGVDVSDDGNTVLATAMGTHRVFSMDSAGNVLDRLDVGKLPKGVLVVSNGTTGAAETAYVLNTLDNTVSVVDASNPSNLSVTATIPVGDDPTPAAVRRGRIAFNDAFASDTGNFSCGSCHPDSHTDQLLWRIGGACPLLGCGNGDEPRSTMPVRGLRDSEPLHWGGELGDPFGGGDGSVGVQTGGGNPLAAPNCDPDVTDGSPNTTTFPTPPNGDCMRQLVDAALSGVMCDQTGGCLIGPSGSAGQLTNQERKDMAVFLRSVSYPVARKRPIDDDVTALAETGFKEFFMDMGGQGPSTCADSDAGCHELPLGTSTNAETLANFDAPTMRGMMDRYLQFSMGVTLAEDLFAIAETGISFGGFNLDPVDPQFAFDPAVGLREEATLGVSFLLFNFFYNAELENFIQMTEEASNGHSGALGRQVTLNTSTTGGGSLAATESLLASLEAADARGAVNLRGPALFQGATAVLSYHAPTNQYRLDAINKTRAQVLADAQNGLLLATLTAHLRSGVNESKPQPLIAPVSANCGTGNGPTGDPALPSGSVLAIEGKHVTAAHTVIVDGVVDAGASIAVGGGAACALAGEDSVATDQLTVTLSSSPSNGMHLLQVQSADGLQSNELPFCVPSGSDCR